MAILNDLIVRGATRCLNTLYTSNLTTDSQTISGDLTVNGYTYMGYSTSRTDTKLSVAGITNNQWYRSTGSVGWYNDSYGGGIYMTDSTYVKTYNNKAFYAYNGLYTGSTQQYYLNVNGKLNAADGVFSNNLNVGNSLVSRNISATNLLRAAKYDLQTITQVGSNGTLYVAPSIQFPTSNTTSVTAASTSITIIDTNITSDVMAGVVWRASSKVKISGTINGVVTGTVDGIITSINTSSKTMVIGNLSGGNWSSVVAGTYTKDKIENLNIMMYETYQNSTYYPVGILLTSYGSVSDHTDGTAKTFIDIFGGSATKPVVRLGNMTGLDAINGVTPSGWGLYTSNGYFSGLIVSTSGKIGGWSIGENSIYNNTNSMTSTAVGTFIGQAGFRNYKSDDAYVNIKDGVITAKGVKLTGEITATSGTIGGSLVSGELTAATINGSKITANSITAGQIATNAITADELAANAVTSAKIKAGEVKATNIASNAVTADKLDATTINASNKLTVGALTTTDQNNILNSKLEIGGRNLFRYTSLIDVMSNKWVKNGTAACSVNGEKLTITGAGEVYPYSNYYTPYVIPIGTTVTLSCYFYENTVSDGNRYIYYAATPGWRNKRVPANYVGLWQETFTLTEELTVLCPEYDLRNSTGGQWVVSPLKLEIGNKATAWSPAPEDIDVHKYITDIDSNKGITIKPADTSGNDYLQMNSSAINFYRNNVETLKIEDSAIRVGKLGNNLRNIYITDSVVQIRNNTSVLAEYGSSIKLYNPTKTTAAVEISSTGASFIGNITATSLTLEDGVTIGISQVENLQTTLNGKQPSGDYATNTALTNSTGWSVIINISAINYTANTATLHATVYKDGAVKTSGFTLQWYKTVTGTSTTTTAISGATSSTLSITNTMGLDAAYTCIVS